MSNWGSPKVPPIAQTSRKITSGIGEPDFPRKLIELIAIRKYRKQKRPRHPWSTGIWPWYSGSIKMLLYLAVVCESFCAESDEDARVPNEKGHGNHHATTQVLRPPEKILLAPWPWFRATCFEDIEGQRCGSNTSSGKRHILYGPWCKNAR